MAISSITRSDGANYEFQINLDTAFAVATTIRWEIHPTAGAFPLALTAPLTGTLDFSTSETSKMVSPVLTRNHPFPRDFEIQLYNVNVADDTLAFTSSEQRIAGDASLPDNSLSISGGGDQNVIGLGLSDTIATSGGSGDDTFIITRFQYGTLEIRDGLTSSDGQNLIKFDYGVTITAYREVLFTVFNDVIVDLVALTLSTGAVVTIVLPAGSFGYQLGSGEVLTYAEFKTEIEATGTDSLRADYAITSFTDAPELSDPRLEAGVARSLSGAGNEDIISAASDYNLTVSGGSGDDVFVITRFQYGTLEIRDGLTSLNGQNLIKFDYEVTITDYAEVSFTVFNDVIVDSVALTLSTGAVVTIVLPAGSFGYQLGDGDVLTYAEFKAAIGATGASDLAGDFTISASSVEFAPIDPTDLVFAENDGDERLTVTATSSDDDGSVAVNSYMFVYADENGVEQVEATHQGFSIDSNGVITIASPLNYEETSSYDLRIRATDANGEEADLSITISVQNVQDGPAEYDIRENQAGTMLSVALFDADPNSSTFSEDPDGRVGEVSFQWFTTPDGGTTKNDITGIADTTSATLDIEGYTPPSGEIIGVTVSYQDPFNVAAGDTTEFDVLLSPIVFSDGTNPVASYAGSINEDSTAATLPTIAARVDNAPQASTFTYEFVTDVDAGTTNATHLGFTIDGQGAITFTGTASTDLDYDTDPVRDSITLRVRATYDADGTGNASAVHTRDVQVVIAVTDLNDNTPEIGELQLASGATAGFGVAEFGSPTSGADTLTGTSADEYINGGAGLDIITSGGGADHIVGGAGVDTVNLEVTSGSVETVYYRFSSTDGGAWVGVDDWVTINDFHRGEDRLVFLDTDGAPIDLMTFLSDGNRGTNGGQLVISPRFNNDKIVGADIKFGSNALRIGYTIDSQEEVRSGNTYNALAAKYLGAGTTPASFDGTDLTDNTLLLNYLNVDGNDNNLLIADDAYLETIVPDVLIAETFTSVDGVFASVSATDADGTAAHSEVSYGITAGTGMGIFEINPTNGRISVASTASLDYDTTASYRLTIGVSDGLDADGTADTAVDATKTFIIGLTDVNDIAPDITVSAGSGTLTDGAAAGTDTGIRVLITDDARGEDFAISYKNFNGFADIAGFGLRQIGAETVIGTTYGLYTTAEFDFDAFAGVTGGGITVLIGVSDILDGTTDRTDEELASVSITFTDINDNGPEVAVSQTDPSTPITLDETTDDTLNSMTPRNVMGLTIEIDDADRTAGHKSGVLGITPTFRVLLASSKDPIPQFDVVKMGANWVLQYTDSPQEPLKATNQSTFEVIIEVSDGENPATESDSFTINVNGEAVYSISESGDTLTADLDTADPNGVQAGSVRYQWFTTTDGGTTKDTIATSGTNSIADTTLRSLNTAGHTLPSGAVYGVEVTYTDDLGIAESVEAFTAATASIKLTQDGSPTSSYTGSINEDASADNLPTIAASVDGAPSGHTITYQFLHSDGTTLSNMDESGTFTLDSGSGEIDLNSTLNHETTPRYELSVRVTYDADGDSTTTNDRETIDVDVVINVGDVNEHAPEFAPSLQVEDDPGVLAGIVPLPGATTNRDQLTGTSADEYIYGDAGFDSIISGGGNDHILGGAGVDGIGLSSAVGNVETVYYRFSSAGTGAWVGSDGFDTITNFRRGEDRLVFLDTDGAPIDLMTFLSDGNRGTAGGRLVIAPIFNDDNTLSTLIDIDGASIAEMIDGVQIRFDGGSVNIIYTTDSREKIFDANEGEYLSSAVKYLGALDNGPDKSPVGLEGNLLAAGDSITSYSGNLLSDHSLLRNYFGDGTHDNLQVRGDDISARLEVGVDVLISESRTSTDGVFATITATDDDGTSPNNQITGYDITGGTGMSLFDIDANGGISVKAGATLDYDAGTTYMLTITATDEGTPTMTSEAKTITIGLDANDIAPVVRELQLAQGVMGGITTLPGATTNRDQLTGTSADEYIYGDAGFDSIISGGGNDHILGGAGVDGIGLSSAVGSVETVYYRFSSAGTGAWVGSDGFDTITNFRRGEDRLVFLDTDGTPISLDDFLSDGNRGTAGGRLVIAPIFNDDNTLSTLIDIDGASIAEMIDGVQIRFDGGSVNIIYTTDSREKIFDANEGEYLSSAVKYLGALDNGPDKSPVGLEGNLLAAGDSITSYSGNLLIDHSLLRNYFGDGTHDNLQVRGDDIPARLEVGADVLISELRTSTDGVFATITATDDDGTSPNNQITGYDITGGTGMELFDIDANGGISVASSATFDYDTTTSYTLEITATDGGTPAMTSEAKTITIGILEDFNSVYSVSRTGDVLTATLDTPDSNGVDAASVRYQWFTTTDGGTTKTPITGIADTTSATLNIAGHTPPANSAYGVTVTYDDNAGNEDETVDAILMSLIKGTSGNDVALAGTVNADYIDGDAGNDMINGGGGNDHILGGAGTDTITLSAAAGSVETVYYRFSSAGTGAWVGSDGVDTIKDFRFGEDRLVFIDTDGTPIDQTTFLSASNLNTAGGQLKIKPIVDTSGTTSTLKTKYGDFLDGVEIIFGSNKIRIEYQTDTRPRTYDPADGDYTFKADALFGPILNDLPSKLDRTTGYLTDNTLLSAYFGDGTHDNLQVTDDDMITILDLI